MKQTRQVKCVCFLCRVTALTFAPFFNKIFKKWWCPNFVAVWSAFHPLFFSRAFTSPPSFIKRSTNSTFPSFACFTKANVNNSSNSFFFFFFFANGHLSLCPFFQCFFWHSVLRNHSSVTNVSGRSGIYENVPLLQYDTSLQGHFISFFLNIFLQ